MYSALRGDSSNLKGLVFGELRGLVFPSVLSLFRRIDSWQTEKVIVTGFSEVIGKAR